MKPMLAQSAPIDLRELTYPVAVEHKYDGVRCIAIKKEGKVTLYSRNMKQFNNFKELEEFCAIEMQDNTVWDGEVIAKDFQELMHRTHAEEGINDDVEIMYSCFDALTLEEWDKGLCLRPYIQRNPTATIAKTYEELDAFYKQSLADGFEGIMIKRLDSPYVSGKSKHWLKLKPTDTADMYIRGFIEGAGKYKGKLGAILCEYGKVKAKVGTGFTDAQRERMWESRDRLLGKIAEIEFQAMTKPNVDGFQSLRFPSFKCLRLDKD